MTNREIDKPNLFILYFSILSVFHFLALQKRFKPEMFDKLFRS